MKKYFKHSNIMYLIYIVALLIIKKFVDFESAVIIGVAFILKTLEEKYD